MDLRASAHEIVARIRVIPRWVRATALALGLAAAGWSAWVGAWTPVALPGVYRAWYNADELAPEWCDDGRLRHEFNGYLCQRRDGTWGSQAELDRYVLEQPRPLRLRPPHPAVVAGLLGAGLFWLWRRTRPVAVTVRANGVRIGDRFIHRDQIRGCRVGTWVYGWRYLVVRTPREEIRTPPVPATAWELEQLCDEIRALAPSESEIPAIALARQDLRARAAAFDPLRRARET